MDFEKRKVNDLMYLYLAHPISGLSGKEIFEYYDNAIKIFGKNFNVLHPMIGKEYLRNIEEAKPSGYKTAISNDHAIFQRDTWMVSKSDIVFCDFTGSSKVSIGCCMELAVASWLNKHTVVVLDEKDIHKHSFILESADVIFDSFDTAKEYLMKF